MVASSPAEALEPEDAASTDSRRWLRDLGVLFALPALWVDHEPTSIISGLVSVLFGVLHLDSAYARFDDPRDDRSLEIWRPDGPGPPPELQCVLDEGGATMPGISTTEVEVAELGTLRVSRLPLSLPWGTALVVVSSARGDFPTVVETHLLRVAVSQAGIAIHMAKRLAYEHAARDVAERALLEQTELLRSLVEDVEPSLSVIVDRLQEARRFVAEVPPRVNDRTRPIEPVPHDARAETTGGAAAIPSLIRLTRRETEVLGLLAQGLSNREIAGVLWLSDRTVERHITGMYRKIGVARRSEATAFALRHGISS